VLEQEYLGRALIDGPAPEPRPQRLDHIGVHPQKDGTFYVGFSPAVGRMSGTLLNQVADLAEAAGSARVRTTVEQNMLVLDVPAERVDALVAGLEALGLRVTPSEFHRGTMACTGIEYCKLAIVETKGRAQQLIGELEDRLPTFDQPITINLNGCPNSCARIQVADIGLKGQLVVDDEGRQVEGFQVHLGGALGLEAGFGRKVRGLKVSSAELTDYVERVVSRYDSARTEDETFASWVARADDEELS
jgi:sulfite reductase (ferredoxin)